MASGNEPTRYAKMDSFNGMFLVRTKFDKASLLQHPG